MNAKSDKNSWGFSRESILVRHLADKPGKRHALVHVFMGKKAMVSKSWMASFVETTSSLTQALRISDTNEGLKILVSPLAPPETENDPRLKSTPKTRVRDYMGALISTLERLEVESAEIDFHLSSDELEAALTGLELALYRYKRVRKHEAPKFKLMLTLKGKAIAPKTIEQLTLLGQGVNLARHLTNLPPNDLNPVTYADFAKNWFSGMKGLEVEVWDEKRLLKEGMNLHLNVGKGSVYQPRLVCLRYRPSGVAKKAPIAIVGKGITFDTGGLDIKPSAGMRLMKKDMGGSASATGLAYWAARSSVKQPMDFYLALAENAISGDSFRPSDVLTARNGMTVEIHNTDAEGRLVLADAMDVAVTAKEKPRLLIDLATLTGAIKVALGGQLAGLFANDAKLATSLQAAGREVGELAWPMPLFQKYRSQTPSTFADMVNAVDGFGGAVTAALFLEKFVKDVPWAHYDIYAWKDSADGCFLEGGGNGQTVMTLATWIKALR